MLAVCNFSPVHRPGYRLGVPYRGTYQCVFNSDDERFGGSGLGDKEPLSSEDIPMHGQEQSLVIDIPPMSGVIYRCTRKKPALRKKAAKAGGAVKLTPVGKKRSTAKKS